LRLALHQYAVRYLDGLLAHLQAFDARLKLGFC
jgi:hypothetical protein